MLFRAGEVHQREAACHCRSMGLCSLAFASVAEIHLAHMAHVNGVLHGTPIPSNGVVAANELVPARYS
jgi:hypothetical protein